MQTVWSKTGKVTLSTVNSRYHSDPVTEGQENTSIGRLTLPYVNEFQAHSSSLTLTTAYIVSYLKGLVHDNAHARRLSLQNKFVGSTLNSKSPLAVQSLTILRFIRTSVALAGLVILR